MKQTESVQEEFTNNAFQSVADRVYVHELSALFQHKFTEAIMQIR